MTAPPIRVVVHEHTLHLVRDVGHERDEIRLELRRGERLDPHARLVERHAPLLDRVERRGLVGLGHGSIFLRSPYFIRSMAPRSWSRSVLASYAKECIPWPVSSTDAMASIVSCPALASASRLSRSSTQAAQGSLFTSATRERLIGSIRTPRQVSARTAPRTSRAASTEA